ncbi:uncharacterized protein JN550_002550 [Neoarthrinium moseri]|uniref:uncharacterized protein n=1 Tax=Neoarthrinium moseri TaxID=1658444 RepID=UPI001FDE3ADC|nr:uncharacterized protein JN550_002550 [Neoarthrinium moseri]KAI1875121.1 hypothetical protein JN550_002550 [Neoarthrinium moseri]
MNGRIDFQQTSERSNPVQSPEILRVQKKKLESCTLTSDVQYMEPSKQAGSLKLSHLAWAGKQSCIEHSSSLPNRWHSSLHSKTTLEATKTGRFAGWPDTVWNFGWSFASLPLGLTVIASSAVLHVPCTKVYYGSFRLQLHPSFQLHRTQIGPFTINPALTYARSIIFDGVVVPQLGSPLSTNLVVVTSSCRSLSSPSDGHPDHATSAGLVTSSTQNCLSTPNLDALVSLARRPNSHLPSSSTSRLQIARQPAGLVPLRGNHIDTHHLDKQRVMSCGPQIMMPGTFHFEAPNGAAPLGGVHAGVFRPPISPSASNSIYLAQSTGSLHSDPATPAFKVKRKRPEARQSTTLNHHPCMGADGTSYERPQGARRASSGQGMRYTLGGHIETPNGAAQRQLGHMDNSIYSDVDYRRALGSKRSHEDLCSPSSRDTADPVAAVGWSRLAFNTIGGVVGKVWEFCKEGAFRGFYAGGGKGYEMQPAASEGRPWCNEHDLPTLPEIPGGFPDSDYAPFCYERETPESTPPPAPKRRQILDGTPNDELRKNWVMVGDPADKKSHPLDPSLATKTPPARPSLNRRISKPVSRLNNPSLGGRQADRVSHAGNATLSNRQPASYASPRSPASIDRPSTPSRLPVPARQDSPHTFSPRSSQQQSRIPSPSPYSPRGHRRNHSTASAASATSVGRLKKRESTAHELIQESSPRLDAEAKRMAMRRLKREQETDARISDFNSKLMDMIRQGKEALGTTVEVDGDIDFAGGGPDLWESD